MPDTYFSSVQSDCHPLAVSIVVYTWWKILIIYNCKRKWMACQFISLKFHIARLWTDLKKFTSSADAESCMQVRDEAQIEQAWEEHT